MKAYVLFSGHLWFLSEYLVTLAFFDNQMSTKTKKKIDSNMKHPKLLDFQHCVKLSKEADLSVEHLVSEGTANIYDAVMIGRKLSSEGWNEHLNFLNFVNIPPRWRL